jgi:hypothetical protein
MKIRPVGAELFHADRPTKQRDTTMLLDAFRNLAKAPKHCRIWELSVQIT